MKRQIRRWTPGELNILRTEFPITPTAELAERLNRTRHSVFTRAARLGLKKNYTGDPNSRSKNGLRPSGKAATRPLGHERINHEGIRQVKTRMDGPTDRRWKSLHLILWEKHHGPVPAGHVVIFRDGDYSNITLDNLECIARAELMRRNSIHRLPPELRHACHLKGVLTRKINEQKRENR